MLRQHYSSPITAVRQWRGYDATANVFNDVNRHLCDDSVFCLDGEGFALRTPAPAGKHSACGNVSLRSYTLTGNTAAGFLPPLCCEG